MALNSSQISNCVTEQMTDIMLVNETNIENPLVKSPESNAFAIRSLMKVPLDLFSKKDRIRIRQGWLHTPKTDTHKSKKKASSKEDDATNPSYELTTLNPEVLALKIKILQLSISYEVSISMIHQFCKLTSSRA